MLATNRGKKPADMRTPSKCKTSHSPPNDVQYSVVKEHHRHRWLRQERLLEITFTHVYNCRPPQRNGALPRITKQFPLTSITTIGVKGTNAFCLHVRNDHAYYYYTPRAIEIAHKIQRYVAAANAVEVLLDAEDKRRSILMEELVNGSIPLPGAQLCGIGSEYPYRSYRSAKLRCEINRVLRKGALGESTELNKLARFWREKSADDEMDLSELRSALSNIGEQCTRHMLEQADSPARGVPYSDVAMCVEDSLQRFVIKPNFDKMMAFLRRDEDLAEKEEIFNRQRDLLRGRSADVFKVPEYLRSLNYELVLSHFDLLAALTSPNDILDELINIAACICLTIHVAAEFPGVTSKRSKTAHRVRSGDCNGVVEPHSESALRSKSTPADMTALVSPVAVGPHPATPAQQDSGVFRAIVSYLQRGDTNLSSLSNANSSTTIALSVEKTSYIQSNVHLSLPPDRTLSQGGEPRPLTICLDTSVESSDEELSVTQLSSASGRLVHLDRGGVSADDMLPLFIHLLCESDVSNICFLVRFVNLLRDPDDSSERAYYLTTFEAAIAVLCEVNVDTVAPLSGAFNETEKSVKR